MNPRLARLLALSGIGWWPVRVRHGPLRGSRWTLWPHSAYWRGNYEPEVQAALLRHLPAAGGAAWDLGAHFGYYSLQLAHAVGPAGQVCAFEPDATSFARLAHHVARNRCTAIRTYPLAVSDRAGSHTLVQTGGKGATTSHLSGPDEPVSPRTSTRIETVSLDDLARRDSLRPPSLLKIDVEGHAGAALDGARETLTAARPRILVSVHSADELAGIRRATADLGYQPADLNDRPLDWEAIIFKTAWLHSV